MDHKKALEWHKKFVHSFKNIIIAEKPEKEVIAGVISALADCLVVMAVQCWGKEGAARMVSAAVNVALLKEQITDEETKKTR